MKKWESVGIGSDWMNCVKFNGVRGGTSVRFGAIALVVLVMTAMAYTQVPTSGNIFLGYSYSGGDVFAASGQSALAFQPSSQSSSFAGWEGSLEGKLLPWIGIVADLSGHYGSKDFSVLCIQPPGSPGCPPSPQRVNARTYTFLFGPRVSVSIRRFTPFAHALFGAGHVSDGDAASNSDTSFATAIGGGLDYKLMKGIAFRLQGDEVHTRFFSSTQDHFRFSTGIVFRF
jgi:opacity protein-like surface antigen